MQRRQVLHTLPFVLVPTAGCSLPTRPTDQRDSPGSVRFRNTTTEQAELQLQACRIGGEGTATGMPTAAPDITVSLTADAKRKVVESSVFPEGEWKLHGRAGSHEATVIHSIRDLASVAVTLHPDKLQISISGNGE